LNYFFIHNLYGMNVLHATEVLIKCWPSLVKSTWAWLMQWLLSYSRYSRTTANRQIRNSVTVCTLSKFKCFSGLRAKTGNQSCKIAFTISQFLCNAARSL
jgi:hypothetical protein